MVMPKAAAAATAGQERVWVAASSSTAVMSHSSRLPLATTRRLVGEAVWVAVGVACSVLALVGVGVDYLRQARAATVAMAAPAITGAGAEPSELRVGTVSLAEAVVPASGPQGALEASAAAAAKGKTVA